MERRLVLVRHAEAASAPVDADRPLTSRGEEQAAAVGRWLAREDLVPDRVVVSPARRAVQTWQRAAAEVSAAPPPIAEQRIYDNTVEDLLAVLQETPEDVGTVVLVGHNPSIGELARALDDGEGDPSARGDLADGFPAAAVAVFGLAAPFEAVEAGTGTLTAFAPPPA